MRRMLAALCLCGMLGVPTAAAPIVDQEFDPPYGVGAWPIYVGGSANEQASQTFTVGVTGMMTAVDAYAFVDPSLVSAPLLIDIRTVTGGVPDAGDSGPHILASATIAPSGVPNLNLLPSDLESYDAWGQAPWLHIDFADFPVTAGQQLALTLRSNDDHWYFWLLPGGISHHDPPPPQYTGGRLWGSEFGGPWITGNDPGGDVAFRTYVIPEPALGALIAPLAALAVRRRRS